MCERAGKTNEFCFVGCGRLGYSMQAFAYIIWNPGVLRKQIVEKFNVENMLKVHTEV